MRDVITPKQLFNRSYDAKTAGMIRQFFTFEIAATCLHELPGSLKTSCRWSNTDSRGASPEVRTSSEVRTRLKVKQYFFRGLRAERSSWLFTD